MGGLNSIAYATRHSDQMRGMVIVDVAPEISASGAERIRDFTSTPELDSPRGVPGTRGQIQSTAQIPQCCAAAFTTICARHRQASGRSSTISGVGPKTAMRSFTEDRVRLASELSRIKCPTLVVRGALSDVLTDDAAEKFAHSLPDGRWVRVEKSGHNVQGDNPRALLDAMLTFFREAGIS